MKHSRIAAACFAALALAQTTTAQSDDLGVCSFSGPSYDYKRLGTSINGNWVGTATGDRVARGVKDIAFTISTDATGSQMMIGGEGVPSLNLEPLERASLSEVPITRPTILRGNLKYTAPGGTNEVEMPIEDMALVTGCATDDAPILYWYRGNETQWSYGVYLFLSDSFGIGIIENSAQGRRRVLLHR